MMGWMPPDRSIDAVIFDLGGVLMRNGRHSDFVKRFPSERANEALEIFVGPFGVDTDHHWHRLERGEISMEECQSLNRAAFAAAISRNRSWLRTNGWPFAGTSRR